MYGRVAVVSIHPAFPPAQLLSQKSGPSLIISQVTFPELNVFHSRPPAERLSSVVCWEKNVFIKEKSMVVGAFRVHRRLGESHILLTSLLLFLPFNWISLSLGLERGFEFIMIVH